LWNRSFVALWVGREHYGGAVVDLLIVCIAFQTAFIRADAFIIDAALRSWLRVLIAAVAAVVTITLAVALTRALGIAGLCLGVLAGRLIQTVAYPVLAGRCVGATAKSRGCHASPGSLRSIARRVTCSSSTARRWNAARSGWWRACGTRSSARAGSTRARTSSAAASASPTAASTACLRARS